MTWRAQRLFGAIAPHLLAEDNLVHIKDDDDAITNPQSAQRIRLRPVWRGAWVELAGEAFAKGAHLDDRVDQQPYGQIASRDDDES